MKIHIMSQTAICLE